jgi:hypothetical protein
VSRLCRPHPASQRRPDGGVPDWQCFADHAKGTICTSDRPRLESSSGVNSNRCEILTMPSVTPLWAALEASADAERTGRMFSWLPPEPLSSEAEEQLAIALQDSDRSCTA